MNKYYQTRLHRLAKQCGQVLRRRLYLLFRKKYILESISKRKGGCNHCSCCQVKILSCQYRCQYFDKKTKLCLVYDTDRMPKLCYFYPFDEKDKWDEFKKRCGFYWEEGSGRQIIKKIPKEISRLYHNLGFKTKIYINLRWRLCPFEKIESFLPLNGIILDLGCGYGLLANYLVLKSSARQVIGLDGSSKRIETAQATIGQRKNIRFIQGDIDEINLPPCQAAVMSDFLHHLPSGISENLIRRIFHSLEKGGQLVIQEVDKKPFWKYLITLMIDKFLNPRQKLYYQPVIFWQDLLEKIGFKVQIRPAHQGLPLADVIFVCQKP